MMIAFADVLGVRQDLQIAGHVQSAHDAAANRNDVIDIVLDAGFPCEPSCFRVEASDRLAVSPRWCRVQFCQFSAPTVIDHLVSVASRPLPISLSGALGVLRSPFCKALLLVGAVLLAPFCERVRVSLALCGRARRDARATRVGESIRRGVAKVEARFGLVVLARAATLQSLREQRSMCGSFRFERWLSLIGFAGFAHIHNAERSAIRTRALEASVCALAVGVARFLEAASSAAFRCWQRRQWLFVSLAIRRCVGLAFDAMSFAIALVRPATSHASFVWRELWSHASVTPIISAEYGLVLTHGR